MAAILAFPKGKPAIGVSPHTKKRESRRHHPPEHFTPQVASIRLLEGKLPPGAVIHGDLRFSESDKPTFPPHVRIKGNLTLFYCRDVKKLGDGLSIKGFADFTGTPLKYLPRNLKVGSYLDLTGTRVTCPPQGLQVRWMILVDKKANKSLKALAAKSKTFGRGV
jgi:hypothetical protein